MNDHVFIDHHKFFDHSQGTFHTGDVSTGETVLINGCQNSIVIVLHFKKEFDHVWEIVLCCQVQRSLTFIITRIWICTQREKFLTDGQLAMFSSEMEGGLIVKRYGFDTCIMFFYQ